METNSPPDTQIPQKLQALVDRLNHPIQSAYENRRNPVSSTTQLDTFIATQIVEALRNTVFPARVEAELLVLRFLFQEQERSVRTSDRLETARRVLGRLSTMALQQTSDSSDSAPDTDRTVLPGHGDSRGAKQPHDASNRPLHETDIRFAKGVGPKRALLLEKLGIRTIEDALWFLPWRYEDRSRIVSISQLVPGEKATIAGTIHHAKLRRTRRRNMTLFTMSVHDETGAVEVVFFNQNYLEGLLQNGLRVVLSGPVVAHPRKAGLQMRTPQYEVVDEDEDLLIHVGRIVPVYHETRGLSSRQLRRILWGLLDAYGSGLQDPLPARFLQQHHWPSLHESIASLHFPGHGAELSLLNDWKTPAHHRLAFEEGFLLQLALALRQRMNQSTVPGIAFRLTGTFTTPLQKDLPFRLTEAQHRVIAEIEGDMRAPRPMNRLLQGDVGSGKTIVALHAMLAACGDGYQAALMAPTEILAEQHVLTLRPYLEALDVPVAFLTGGTPLKERAAVLERIAAGDVRLVVGTHALLEQDVQFARLGVVVVDEQHKFGVLQRGKLREKALHPDVLVMTATPIPRTLAMTVYGDLDVSVIDELPAGRKPIRTRVFRHNARPRAYELVRKEVNAGRQAYIVYPLVEESEKLDLEAVMQAAERLRETEFPGMNVGILHGRMKSGERAGIMKAFRAGDVHILVATTVIEVGVDVPNATVMVIEHADRFGLAQLHQLRGRVGRGAQHSFCFLISSAGRRQDQALSFPTMQGTEGPALPFSGEPAVDRTRTHTGTTQTAEQRLKAMVQSSDGFAIAEQDLRIRGPGEMLGTRQSGIPEFRVMNLVRDATVLEQARHEAFALMERDPELAHPDHRLLKATVLRRWQTKLDLGSIG
ncbi:MAG: ATP-dependent DNA helicase RecG [Nitrospira sp.]|nr:ATP-dependent DNA helicase RecG [Nitrospira sp.]